MLATPEKHKHLPTPLKSNRTDLQGLYLLLTALKLHPKTHWIVIPNRTLELLRKIRVSNHLNFLALNPRGNEHQFRRHKLGDESEHTTKLRFCLGFFLNRYVTQGSFYVFAFVVANAGEAGSQICDLNNSIFIRTPRTRVRSQMVLPL